MANPRKFSEKIALHTQKQAEETAAFEAIMKEVNSATRSVVYAKQHLPISPPLGTYRGGSLPNVNQIGANQGVDLQTALQHLEDIKQGRPSVAERIHPRADRQRHAGSHRQRPFPADKRVDCSPYGSTSYLSPPPDTSWRRTHSDSALHTSAMGPAQGNGNGSNEQQYTHPSNTPPTHKRIREVLGEDSPESLQVTGYWDPKKMGSASRPKSCEVPNINIYPSQEQELAGGGTHIPISNNTGSLPDLTVLHFPSPLTTPLDTEDGNAGGYGGNSSPSSLSPTSPHHMTMPPPQSPQSPAQRRRHMQPVPSPLVLNNTNQMHAPLSPPVDPSRLPMDPRIAQQYMLHMHQQRQRFPHHHHHHHHHPPKHHAHSVVKTVNKNSTVGAAVMGGVGMGEGSGGQGVVIGSLPSSLVTSQPLPQVNVCGPSDQQASMTQYRTSVSEAGCQSPTSPHSAPSYSPSQSPVLPPANNVQNSPFADAYYSQQQQQTSALQHQFEQFNMENVPNSSLESQLVQTKEGLTSSQLLGQNHPLQFSHVVMQGLGSSMDFQHQSNHQHQQQQQHQQHQQQQQQQQQQQPPPNFFHSDMQMHGVPQVGGYGLNSGMLPSHLVQQGTPTSTANNNNIPDIILTGVDDPFSRTPLDFAKELGNAITGMAEGFDADFLSNDEAFKADLGQLDFDGFQMLTDPNMVTDPATEDTFKLDRL